MKTWRFEWREDEYFIIHETLSEAAHKVAEMIVEREGGEYGKIVSMLESEGEEMRPCRAYSLEHKRNLTASQIAEVIRKMPSFAPNLRAQRESCATAFANQLFPSDFRKAMEWRDSALVPVSPAPAQ